MRSLLFTPALRPDRAVKAWHYEVDTIILDLEDAVPAECKDEARTLASQAISGTSRPWAVRVNGLGTKWARDDLEAVLQPNLAYLMLPKVQSADDIRSIEDILAVHERRVPRDLPIRLLPIIESVQGLSNARAIGEASERVVALTFGEGDFSLDLGVDWDPFGTVLTAAKVQLAIESRLAGIGRPHAGAYPHLHDPGGLERSCQLARELGYATKHCIHPEQIPVVRRIFAPSAKAVERAQEIVRRFEEALAQGSAAITVGAEFIDYPVYHRAKQTLEEASQP